MADSDSTAFSLLGNIADDTTFVHRAMDMLGFFCEFAELTIADMQLTLALATHLKCTQRRAETWES